MPALPDISRRLDEPYVTTALRTSVNRRFTDPSRGEGFVLALGTAEAAVELQLYPDHHALVLTNHLVSLELTDITTVRRSGSRLRFAATHGTQRVVVAISRRGEVSVRAHDRRQAESRWRQGVLPLPESDTPSPSCDPPEDVPHA